MSQRINILQELKELGSSLPPNPAAGPYLVPAGYFEGLAGEIMMRIRLESNETGLPVFLATASRQVPYSVPEGYFEQLAENSLASLKDAREELETLSPLLSGIKKDVPYTTPGDYFQISVIPAREEHAKAKVVGMGPRRWMRYAAAAVLAGALVLGGFFILENRDPEAMPLARFEKKLNKEIRKMSDKELNDFIQYTDAALTGEEKVSVNTNHEIGELLKDVPDAELKEFLEETSDMEAEPGLMN